MAWFQHEIGMYDDRKVKRLRAKFGLEGYGFWCFLLEQIGKEGNICRLSTSYSHSDLGIDTGLSPERIKELLDYMADIGLTNKDLYVSVGMVCIPQFARYYDDYHRKVRNKLREMTGQQPVNDRNLSYKRDREIDRVSEGNYIKDNNDSKGLIELAQQDLELAKALKTIGIVKKEAIA